MAGNLKSLSNDQFNGTAYTLTIPNRAAQAGDEQLQLLAKILGAVNMGPQPPATGTSTGTGASYAATTFDLTTSGAGTLPAGYYYAEFYNGGSAGGFVNSQFFPAGATKSYPTIPGVYLPAITYNAAGTVIVITATRA